MSLRYEQYNSLMRTQELLRNLLTVEDYPKTKKKMRKRASACLRHFPFLHKNGQPMWSQDTFTDFLEDVEK